MRLFIGIDLPVEIKNHIELSVYPLQVTTKGWEHPHDYHLTLLFIGETPPIEIPFIVHQLNEITFTPFSLTLKTIEFFNRRVLYLSCEDSLELLNLRKDITFHFSKYKKPETKKFIPHITLKRWQRYEFDELKKRIEENPFVEKSIRVDHLALFKSEKDADNRKYHVLKRT